MAKTIVDLRSELRCAANDPANIGAVVVCYVVDVDGAQIAKDIVVDTDIDTEFPGPASADLAIALQKAKDAEGIP